MSFSSEQIDKLEAPLDPKHVKKPSGGFGPKGDYLEGWHVINELNRIFGFGAWSYTIDLTRDALDRVEGKDQWQAAYTCVCTLTVQTENGNVVRQDVGFGSGFAKQVGDAIEGATKEAATDALKRAARTFGNAFGLALYDKDRVNVQAPPPPTITDDQHTELVALLEGARMPVAAILNKARENTGLPIKDLRELPASELDGIRTAALNRTDKQKEAA